jgi:hypothetical protein
MKLDKFTWTVIGVVLLLIVAAIVTVSRTGGKGVETPTYMDEDTPEAAVHNAFIALQQGDRTRAEAQYSQAVRDDIEGQSGWDPFGARPTNTASRLRITNVEIDDEDPNRALVSFVQDTFSRGGLFNAGSTWSREGTVEVVQEEDGWKINTQEFFF